MRSFMMAQKNIPIFAALAAFGFTACVDHSSPKGVVGSAYSAITKSEIKEFKETLILNALEEYGSRNGMLLLQTRFSGMELKIDEPILASDERLGNGWRGLDHYRNYVVEVSARSRTNPSYGFTQLAVVITRCHVAVVLTGRDNLRGERMDCRISDVIFR
jgi:hypothetical protein